MSCFQILIIITTMSDVCSICSAPKSKIKFYCKVFADNSLNISASSKKLHDSVTVLFEGDYPENLNLTLCQSCLREIDSVIKKYSKVNFQYKFCLYSSRTNSHRKLFLRAASLETIIITFNHNYNYNL